MPRPARVVLLALAFAGFARPGLSAAQQTTTLTLPGLDAPVEILKDEWGISHIYAETEHDLFFAQGWNAARDRLFQLEIWRAQATGTTAEILGPRAVERDRGTRLFEFRGDMTQEMRHYHPRGDEIIPAYVDGINAYIARALERLREAGMPNEALDQEWQEQDRAVTEYLSNMMEGTGLTGDRVEVRIVHGHPVEEIENHVKDFDAGLVVMGGHSRSRLTRWLPGRVASRLVHQLPCDVMLARGG